MQTCLQAIPIKLNHSIKLMKQVYKILEQMKALTLIQDCESNKEEACLKDLQTETQRPGYGRSWPHHMRCVVR